MVRRGEIGAAAVLAAEHGHYLLYIKCLILKSALKNSEWWLGKPLRGKDKLVTNELIRIEIIATTVHYAETFAATLLAMRKYKRFHKFLLEYKPPEINEFYSTIASKRPSYVIKLLQYPSLRRVGEKEQTILKESAGNVHSELKKLAEFYFQWHDFYNTYKHGMRLLAGKPNPKQNFTVLGYFHGTDNLNSLILHETKKEVRKALHLCGFMFHVLSSAESVFFHDTIMKEEKFNMRLYFHDIKKARRFYKGDVGT